MVPEGVITLLRAQGFFRMDLETGSHPRLCRHSTGNPCWRERGGTSASSRRCPAPLSLSIHPGTVPPPSLPPRSRTWDVMGGRQPRQWGRRCMASLCWKSSLPIMTRRLPAPVGEPMGGTEMTQSWCLKWKGGRPPDLSLPCSWLASGLSLEPAGGPPARYQWSQRLLTPDPTGQSGGPLPCGELPVSHTLHGSEV